VHHQLELRARGKVAGPVADELGGLCVELALAERRGIEGVEELRQVAQAQLDAADVAALA